MPETFVLAASGGGHHAILTTISLAIFLGITAQMLAERFRLPAILPLLLFGIAAGGSLWRLLGVSDQGLIDPSSLGSGLEVLIHLGIAIILFEGGLSLDPRQLQRVGGAVRNLLTLGAFITFLGGSVLFRVVTEMPWSTAALFGAIVTVTGPTVIVPLLRHMIVPRRVSTILVSEGLIIDPIGAVAAYMVLQTIERGGMPIAELGQELFFLTLIGSVLGFAAGALANLLIKRRLVGGELRNLSILAVVVVCYLLSEMLSPQSGILAAVVMGFTMSSADVPDVAQLRNFKEQLTVLLISVLFVLLAAQLDLQAVVDLGLGGLLVVAGLILLVRPLSVFLSIMPQQLGLKERAVVALTAPRGIVAAAVASLAARQLNEAGLPGGPSLEGMVYVTIILTGIWATVMAVVLPRALGYAQDPTRRLITLVGANPLAFALADVLKANHRAVALIDTSRRKLEGLKERGIVPVPGDARDASSFEQAGFQRDSQAVILTTNDDLNLLAAELVRDEFGVEHPVVALQRPPEEFGTVRRAWVDLLANRPVDLLGWNRRLESKRARVVTVDLTSQEARDLVLQVLEERPDQVLPMIFWSGELPSFRMGESVVAWERVTLLVAGDSDLHGLVRFLELPEVEGAEEDDGSEEAADGEPGAAVLPPVSAGSGEQAEPDERPPSGT